MARVAEVINLRHVYPGGVEALKNINLVLEQGTKVAIIGQNGSGKTTLAKHFNGLLKPTSGKVFVSGIDTSTKSTGELSRVVGYVFQNPNHQLFSKTVKEEIEFGLKNIGLKGEALRERLIETLDFFGLRPLAFKQPLSFSSGVRKLVALASVYAMRPPILILDEPTTGQDYPGKVKIGQMIQKMADSGHTIVVITHDMNFVCSFLERVVVMAQGEIVQDGTPREIFSDYEVMDKAHIEPPQIFTLAKKLAADGLELNALTHREMAEALVNRGLTQNG
ncbi:energy-coupling factor ABC transporter ATP-binding protein [Neomoorella thermoacetica]|uniref:energy-coupling factor ABC transporter ATP-binding protein n=1 Tax=Neomoorella thermoacetica TaxID=1525 RepID=UPI0008FB85A7|nr:ATP-binding cassette domain-containing protein [Moorella thermoacetica]OIQ53804.1 energy-coupling factor transporter ATP-binding protein EcfA2 [Moorella thermoacetica]